MKIVAIFIAAAVAALSFSSCNKIEDVAEENHGIKFNITVANPDGPDSKAVKTGWANGDKINIWFDGHVVATPDLIITYNGTSWVPGELSSTVQKGLKTDNSGTMVYFYEGGNDLSYYKGTNYGSFYQFAMPEGSTPSFYAPKLMLSSHGNGDAGYSAMNYVYDGAELTLDLNRWGYITNIQVVVTGLTGAPEDWYLKGEEYSVAGEWWGIQDFRLFDAKFSAAESSRYSRGTANADGVAFYFRIKDAAYYNVANTNIYAKHNLTLTNGTNTYKYTKTNTPFISAYKENNSGASSPLIKDNTFTAIKIAFSSFTAE